MLLQVKFLCKLLFAESALVLSYLLVDLLHVLVAVADLAEGLAAAVLAHEWLLFGVASEVVEELAQGRHHHLGAVFKLAFVESVVSQCLSFFLEVIDQVV